MSSLDHRRSHYLITSRTDTAVKFSDNRAQTLYQRLFDVWRDRSLKLTTAVADADALHERALMRHTFHDWQVRRKSEERKVKQARIARRWFLKREVWSRWRNALDERARQQRLQYWNLAKKRDYFARTWPSF